MTAAQHATASLELLQLVIASAPALQPRSEADVIELFSRCAVAVRAATERIAGVS